MKKGLHLFFIAAFSGIGILSAQTQSFNYTGSIQSFTVAPCVTQLTVKCWGGGAGGGGRDGNSAYVSGQGGGGAYATTTFSVTPGEVLDVYVGGNGLGGLFCAVSTGGGAGGWGYGIGGKGGDAGGSGCSGGGGGGGGGSAVLRLATPLIVGGGGGSGAGSGRNGPSTSGSGGAGGVNGIIGEASSSPGTAGANGTIDGTNGGSKSGDGPGAGAGGGGLNGGTGGTVSGAFDSNAAGGGGGASFAPAGTITNGSGMVPGNAADPDLCAGCAAGGDVPGNGDPGTNGFVKIFWTQPSTITTNIPSQTNVSCKGGNNGAASATASGGTPPYTYVWSNGQSTSSVTGLSAGTYTVTVSDGSVCNSGTQTVTITEPLTGPSASVTATNPVCSGQTIFASATVGGGNSPYNYFWNTGITTSSITPIVITSVPATYSVFVTVTDANGCTSFASTTVSVNPLPVITMSAAVSICSGQSTSLTASSTGNYLWSPGGQTTSGITVTPAASTNYSVVASDGNGCTNTATVSVTVNPLPAATIIGPTSICSGQSATLTASGGNNYVWSQGGQTSAAITVNPGASTNYSVTVTDAKGCTKNASASIAVNPSPTAGIAGSTIICIGQSATLIGSGGTNYSWSNGATTASISPNPAFATNYSLTVTDANGCTNTATALVIVNPLPAVAVTGNTLLCIGDTATLSVSGGTNYLWSTGATSNSISVNPAASTTYTVTATNGSGCSASLTVTVTISSPPVASATSATICAGQTAILTAAGGNNYSWSTGASTAYISLTASASASYSVIVSVGTCVDTASATVTVNPNPTAAAASNVTISQGESTTLSASGGGGYLWSNGSAGASITVSPMQTTQYCVTVTDANQCSDTSCVTVTVEPLDCSGAGELYLPNAFSPNNDGENDLLQVYYGNFLCLKSLHLLVYNRWGEKVFETTDAHFQWDGIYTKGLLQWTVEPESAVFMYRLKAELLNGNKIERKGNITLIR